MINEWQPIETLGFKQRVLGAYKTKGGVWMCEVVGLKQYITTASGKVFPATHWMPLPEPPQNS